MNHSRTPILFSLFATCLLLLSGCASHVRIPAGMPPSAATSLISSDGDITVFSYQPGPLELKLTTMEGRGNSTYQMKWMEFPSAGINGQKDNLVTGEYRQSMLPGKKPLLIVMPLYGSYDYPSDEISAGAARYSHGEMHVLNLQGDDFMWDWEGLVQAPDPDSFRKVMAAQAERVRTNVIDVRRIIDWAETRPEIDSSRIALIGFSHGALVASATVISEPRLERSILVMGCANPHELVATCPLERTDSVKKMVKERFGWDVAEYQAQLEPIFRYVNIAHYAGRVDPKKVLIIDSYYDECMPKTARDAQWEALGRPERISYKYGHKRSFLSMTPLGFYNMRNLIYAFLDEGLNINGVSSQMIAEQHSTAAVESTP
jgi:hypothetical protein